MPALDPVWRIHAPVHVAWRALIPCMSGADDGLVTLEKLLSSETWACEISPRRATRCCIAIKSAGLMWISSHSFC